MITPDKRTPPLVIHSQFTRHKQQLAYSLISRRSAPDYTLLNLGVSFSISPLWRSVVLWESHQLYHVECILSAFDILQNILYAASFSSERGKKHNFIKHRINKYALFVHCRVAATVEVKITRIQLYIFVFHE